MKAVITGESEELVGVNLRDNDGVEHVLEMTFEGELTGYESEYPQQGDRTDEQQERVNQVCRFAQYYVFVERGYDTIPADENPFRIDAVRHAIAEMDLEEFETHFGDLYQQLAYEEGGGGSPAFDVPPEATDPCIYCKDLYLGIDPFETDLGDELAESHGLDVIAGADTDLTGVSDTELESWGAFSGEFAARAVDEELDLEETVYLADASDLYVKYPDGARLAVVDDHLEPAARDPDTVIELLPIDPQSLEYFQSFLDHYLRCQIRDSFVKMGVQPPEEFRVLGMGRFMSARSYEYVDFYPEFHNPNAKAFH